MTLSYSRKFAGGTAFAAYSFSIGSAVNQLNLIDPSHPLTRPHTNLGPKGAEARSWTLRLSFTNNFYSAWPYGRSFTGHTSPAVAHCFFECRGHGELLSRVL